MTRHNEQTLQVTGDGVSMSLFICRPADTEAARPAVMVSHAWAGQTDFERDKARALADLGYVGCALDLYGDGRTGSNKDENAAMMQPLLEDRAGLQARLQASLAAVCKLDEVDRQRVGAIGFCFGGLCVLDLARTGAEVAGVVSFHGLFGAPDNLADVDIKASVLVLHGWNDPMVPPDQVLALAREMEGAGADWQLHAYGDTVHAFTNPAAADPDFGTVYSPSADGRSWQTMVNFLAEVFAPV